MKPGSTPADDLKLEVSGCGAAAQGNYVADCPCGKVGDSAVPSSFTFLVSLVAVTALGPLAMSSFIPALPSIQIGFQVSAATAQLALSVSLVSMAVCSLLYGQLADRYGRRPVFLAGVTLAVVGSVFCAVAPTMEWVILGRAMQAAGATVGFVLARVVVRDVYGEQRATTVLSYVTAAITLAPMAGPMLGGYLIDHSGWRSVFWVVAVYAAVLLGMMALRLPETRTSETLRPKRLVDPPALGRLVNTRGFPRYLIFGSGLQGTFMAFIAGAPYVAQEFYQLPARVYGWYFIVVPIGYFFGSMISGRFSEQLGIERCLLIGGLLALFSCTLALGLSLWLPISAWTFFGPAALLATAHGIAQPSAQIGLLNSAGQRSGMASGLFSFTQLMIGATVAQAVGFLLNLGPVAVTACMVGTAIIAMAALLAAPRAAVGDTQAA